MADLKKYVKDVDEKINIVLIEPEIPQNTGNIARTCAATGAALHLVEPMGFTITDSKLKRAGLDYWDKLTVRFYKDTDEFFERNKGETMFFFSKKAPRSYCDVTYPERVFLVFGKETKGIDESILRAHLDSTVRIPMRESLRSLNLSNAVAVAVYETLRQRSFAGLAETSAILGND